METYSRLFVALVIGVVFGIITSAAPRRKTSLNPSYQESLAKNRAHANQARKKLQLSRTQELLRTQELNQAKKHASAARSNRFKNL